MDVAGVRREAAKRARISAEDEYRTANDRFLVLQPSSDESWWKLFGGLDGASGSIVDKVLTEMADQLPALPDGTRGDTSWRKATALVELALSMSRHRPRSPSSSTPPRPQNPDDLRPTDENHPTRPAPGHLAPGRQPLRRRWMRQPQPAPNPSHHPLVGRRTNRPGQSDHLCWYHHHIVIHQQGFQLYRHPDHGRIRFHKPDPRGPPVSMA